VWSCLNGFWLNPVLLMQNLLLWEERDVPYFVLGETRWHEKKAIFPRDCNYQRLLFFLPIGAIWSVWKRIDNWLTFRVRFVVKFLLLINRGEWVLLTGTMLWIFLILISFESCALSCSVIPLLDNFIDCCCFGVCSCILEVIIDWCWWWRYEKVIKKEKEGQTTKRKRIWRNTQG